MLTDERPERVDLAAEDMTDLAAEDLAADATAASAPRGQPQRG